MKLNRIHIILGIIVAALAIAGYIYSYDQSLVKQPQFIALERQVNEYVLQQRIDFYQKILWDLEDRYKTHNCSAMPGEAKTRCRHATKELMKAKEALNRLRRKG